MRIVFMGTPDFAVPTLDALHDAGHEIVAVYTQPPRPAGRGKADRSSPVQVRAEALGLPVRSPASLKSEAEQDAFAALEPDAAIVAAYGLILPQAILDIPVWECLNVHASLLPRWRGAAPVQRAILAGDTDTGVTIMAMEAGLDTGDMLAVETTPVAAKDAGALTAELAKMGARMMAEVLADPGDYPPQPQPADGVAYAAKIDKAEARIDFARPAVEIERQVRAFAPAPGAWFEHAGERIRILAAEVAGGSGAPGTVLDDALLIACGTGAIRPVQLQRAGRGVMPAAELLRGFSISAGTLLEPSPLGERIG
ncbi:methionyl-tRNA formyltransferase [uncultured Sphingomonas sp.]|uniref:methionyl-tRNA formyltransferase n=1 Tax=uncultured Sphingomonas sp. TaxID=158754 RepID=UPI0025D59214|nr:methionyl-tRNA formyltransferase [uncultured Sphingomonas sp.]